MREGSEDDPGSRPVTRPAALAETLQHFSHDIRSAMSDVIGGLRLVDRARLAPEAQLQIERVAAAADTLAALVDGALMAAAGETLIQSDVRPVAPEEWLAALTGRWLGRASEAGSPFRVERAGPLPERITVPQVALDRLVGNLISNALSHAPGADVTLRIGAARGAGLTITVADAGPGYPQTVLERVGQGDDATPIGSRAGSGLGLRIALELSRMLGGALTLSNARGGGAEAQLALPDHVLDWDGADATPATPPDLSGLKVLVAEDNLTNQTILRQLLATMQAEAVFVADGTAAIEVLEREAFDIALIDIEMPRLSGLEVMARVRARGDELAQLPMVALTAYVLRDNREAIYAAGADGIIGKPILSGTEFGRAILRYAGHPTDLPEPEDVLSAGSAEGGLGRKFDMERFAALLEVAGPEGAVELIERLHEDLGAVRSSLDAAIAANDIPEIRGQTHILIAVAGAVGAERLHRLAEVLNIAAKRRRHEDLGALYAPCRVDLEDLIAHVEGHARRLGVSLGSR